jgi:hypothetical protein
MDFVKFALCAGTCLSAQILYLRNFPLYDDKTQRPQRNQTLLYTFESLFITFFSGWAM